MERLIQRFLEQYDHVCNLNRGKESVMAARGLLLCDWHYWSGEGNTLCVNEISPERHEDIYLWTSVNILCSVTYWYCGILAEYIGRNHVTLRLLSLIKFNLEGRIHCFVISSIQTSDIALYTCFWIYSDLYSDI